ncbi:MAG: FHA domain-containing protein [Lachnospiraceae bacterium]|nr:FHA domain-containing protein [Lachnospiraceae bacterium]
MKVEVIYKREQGRNYIMFPGKGTVGIQTEMIRRNKIAGLADFYMEWDNDKWYYGYDITGAQPLCRILDVRPLTGEETERIIEELAEFLQRMELFLLDRDKLVLEPELLYVYADREGHICSGRQGCLFFFCEDLEGTYGEHLRALVLYLFEKADEENRELVEFLFRLHRTSARQEPDAEALLACLDQVRLMEPGGEELYLEDTGKQEKALYEDRLWEERGEEETYSRSGKVREGRKVFGDRKGFLMKLFKKTPVPPDEMWDDLEPVRFKEEKAKVPDEKEKRVDRPTEVLYVEETRRVPALIETKEKKKVFLEHFPFYIGTQEGLDYCPEFQGVSRIHLKLDKRGDTIWITDLNSTNGTGLNGETLKPNEERRLNHGDQIWLAGLVYEFDRGEESW